MLTLNKSDWKNFCFLLSVFLCFSQAEAQTNPTPHILKNGDYIFTNFNSNPTTTTYPPSIQGWSGVVPSNQPTAPTTLQATGNEPLCVGCSQEVTTINNERVNGLGIQSQYSATKQGNAFAIAMALNTTDCYGVKIAWLGVITTFTSHEGNVSVIQPQYRIGSSGAWTTLNEQYVNNVSSSVSDDHVDFVTTLPAAANNKSLVQIRWVLYTQTIFSYGNQFAISKIHVMPDSIAGQTGYIRAGGNVDSTGARPYFNPYDPLYIKEFTTFSGGVTPFSFASNRSGLNKGYSDYSSMAPIFTIQSGDAFDFDIISGPGYVDDTHTAGVYVDWNQDLDFIDSDEFFPITNTQAFTSHTGSITVPATAKSGVTRLRVRLLRADLVLTPGGPSPDGETEDYTIRVDNLTAPLVDCVDKNTCVPKMDSVVCNLIDSLKWSASVGADGYRITLIDSASGTKLVNQDTCLVTAYKVSSLISRGKTYKWIAVPYDVNGNAVGCDTLVFRTAPNAEPIASILPPNPTINVCQGDALQLDGNPSLGSAPYTHSWNGTQNTQLSDTSIVNPTFNSNVAVGGYTFSYTVKDANGCKGSDLIVIQVVPAAQGGVVSSSAAGPICNGADTTLTITSGVGTIRWEKSSSSTGPWSSTTLVQESATTYRTGVLNTTTYFQAIATNGSCLDTSNVVMITVNPAIVKPLVTPASAVICQGQSVTLKTSNYSSGITWNDAANTVNNELVVTTSGAYIATATVAGCPSKSDPITVTVNPKPVRPSIQVIGNNPACLGETVELISSSATGNTWNSGQTTQSIVINYTGNFTVTVTNSFGCSSTSFIENLVFNPSPAKPVITSSISGALCQGESAVLTSSNPTGNNWNTGEITQSITVSSAGSYSVTAESSNGCSATSDDYQLVVNPLPAKPTISQTPAGPVCDGSTVELSSSPAQSYLWNTGSTLDKITVGMSGAYALTITDANGCENTSSVFNVIFNPLPAKPTISASSILCSGRPAVLTSSEVGNNLWSTGILSQSISITANGDYTVTNTDANGCSATSDPYSAVFNSVPAAPSISQDADTLTAIGVGVRYQWYDSNGPIAGANTSRYEPTVSGEYFVTSISAEGCESDQSAGVWFSGTGIFNRLATLQLKIYPNPNNGKFEVALPSMSIGEWTLFDVSGRVVGRESFSSAKLTINVALSKGVYLLQVKVGDTNFMQRIEVN